MWFSVLTLPQFWSFLSKQTGLLLQNTCGFTHWHPFLSLRWRLLEDWGFVAICRLIFTCVKPPCLAQPFEEPCFCKCSSLNPNFWERAVEISKTYLYAIIAWEFFPFSYDPGDVAESGSIWSHTQVEITNITVLGVEKACLESPLDTSGLPSRSTFNPPQVQLRALSINN